MAVKQTVKEQVESLKISAQYQAVKLHVRRNKKLYIGIGIGASVVLVIRRPSINIVNAPIMSPVFNNTVNNGGHMRKIIRCIETGEMWPSITATAEDIGKSINTMSKHLNGYPGFETVGGMHYVIDGLASG